MRVYGYSRVSSRGQIDGDGLPRQREAIRTFCEQHKLTYCGEFAERGVPGKTEASNRPAWSDMMDCVKNRRDRGTETIDAIVVERMDRLARDLIVSEMLLTELRKRGLKIFATDQGIQDIASNDGDPTAKLIRQVIAAVAEFSKSELVKKLRLARERADQRRGYPSGFREYGIRPGEKIILDLVLQMRADGITLRKIAQHLEDEGLRNRVGKPFTFQGVCELLKNRERKKLCTDQPPSDL
jgi:DNA invertase Pin-like site-specific DNA recombinase